MNISMLPKLLKKLLSILCAVIVCLNYSSNALAESIPSNIDNREHIVEIHPSSSDSACQFIAGSIGGIAGASASLGVVASLGSAAGLGGGAAVTSGLAGLGALAGGIAGGAMATGLAAVAAVPVLTGMVATAAFCHKEISQSIIINNGDINNPQINTENH
jgi:hypothetical protein